MNHGVNYVGPFVSQPLMDKLFQNKYEASEFRPTQLYQISEKVDHQELKYGRSD